MSNLSSLSSLSSLPNLSSLPILSTLTYLDVYSNGQILVTAQTANNPIEVPDEIIRNSINILDAENNWIPSQLDLKETPSWIGSQVVIGKGVQEYQGILLNLDSTPTATILMEDGMYQVTKYDYLSKTSNANYTKNLLTAQATQQVGVLRYSYLMTGINLSVSYTFVLDANLTTLQNAICIAHLENSTDTSFSLITKSRIIVGEVKPASTGYQPRMMLASAMPITNSSSNYESSSDDLVEYNSYDLQLPELPAGKTVDIPFIQWNQKIKPIYRFYLDTNRSTGSKKAEWGIKFGNLLQALPAGEITVFGNNTYLGSSRLDQSLPKEKSKEIYLGLSNNIYQSGIITTLKDEQKDKTIYKVTATVMITSLAKNYGTLYFIFSNYNYYNQAPTIQDFSLKSKTRTIPKITWEIRGDGIYFIYDSITPNEEVTLSFQISIDKSLSGNKYTPDYTN